jgi:hypothetical protein
MKTAGLQKPAHRTPAAPRAAQLRAAQIAPRNRAYTPRQFCYDNPAVPVLLTPRPVVERLL